ncbi:hypothetical protein NL108_012016 [Boleophthalmus pectinirostris]|nr:hypothetical protein NL108_012016 [Boleophthalmus pectinirostris]
MYISSLSDWLIMLQVVRLLLVTGAGTGCDYVTNTNAASSVTARPSVFLKNVPQPDAGLRLLVFWGKWLASSALSWECEHSAWSSVFWHLKKNNKKYCVEKRPVVESPPPSFSIQTP